MGFFKNVFKGIAKVTGKVTKAVGGVVGKVAHGVVKNIPVVGSVYGAVTNIVGKDLGDVGQALGNVTDNLASKIYDKGKVTATDSANAEEIHENLQVDTGKTEGFQVADHDNKLVSFNNTPSYDGMYMTGTPNELAYDTNPLVQPATIASGVTNDTIVNAIEKQGINPEAVQVALTGAPAKGKKVDLSTILDLVSNTANTVKDTLSPAPVVELATAGGSAGSNKLPLILGGAGLLGLLAYLFTRK
jgi:hypothetical protein